jgi:PIN domain nuclease of toxin-antitoxin system
VTGLLLDTHALLWYLGGDSRLSQRAKDAIESGLEVYVSAATIWEIAIKRGLGKLRTEPDLVERITTGFEHLAITLQHAWATSELPQHHGDPFDRLLVAQARAERLPLLSADPKLRVYDVDIIWD